MNTHHVLATKQNEFTVMQHDLQKSTPVQRKLFQISRQNIVFLGYVIMQYDIFKNIE